MFLRSLKEDAAVRQSSNEPDERILAMLRRAEPAALLVVVITTVLTIGLWFIPRFAALVPPIWSKMVANTAVGLLLAAVSLALSAERRSPNLQHLSQAAGLVVLTLGISTLTEYAADVSLGIDTWLPSSSASLHPGRPSPQTALALALLGTSLLVIREYRSGRSILADLSAIMLAAFCLLMIAGRFFGATSIVGINASTLMSPQTLLCISCLAFVVVARRAKRGRILSVLVNIGIGSQIVRMVLPAAILLPYASIAAIAYLVDSQTMDATYAHAFTATGETLAALCIVVWMAWRINALERQLRDMSLTDELTNVNNRRGFYFLAQQAFREATHTGTGMTLLFFDLDGLKRANDTIGHQAGSKLIQSLAALLMETFRDSDVVGRVGGDEFAVATLRDGEKARQALGRLNRAVADLNKSAAQEFPLSFSVGMSELNAGSSESFEDLVARADTRMYEDKAQRKLRVAVPLADSGPTLKTDSGAHARRAGQHLVQGGLASAATDH